MKGSRTWHFIHVCNVCLDKINLQRKTYTVKPVLSGLSKRRSNIGFQNRLSFNAGQKYCKMRRYFRPSLNYHLTLGPLFDIILSDRLR